MYKYQNVNTNLVLRVVLEFRVFLSVPSHHVGQWVQLVQQVQLVQGVLSHQPDQVNLLKEMKYIKENKGLILFC